MSISSTVNFNKLWGDTESNKRLAASEKGKHFHEAEIENALRDMALRFERAPNANTIKLWATDLAAMGYKCDLVKTVCRNIPFKMDKHPTLNEIISLIKPYLPQDEFKVDDLTDLSGRVYDHVKAKFLELQPQKALDQMVKLYMMHVVPDCQHFSTKHKEMMVLNDWLRSYFKKGEDILKQGLISNEQFKANNLDYFINPLKRYAKENNL
jgi:hypothetical protein